MSTPADRARAERAAQGLETPAPASAVRAYAATAAVLFPLPSAVAAPSDHLLATGVADSGAASGAGGSVRVRAVGEVGDGKAPSARRTSAGVEHPPAPHTKKARPVAAERTPDSAAS